MPQMEIDIVALADPESQIDPKFQTTFKYTRITAKAMREVLMTRKGWADEQLPCEKSISNILNRLGFRLRRVQKAKPLNNGPQNSSHRTQFMKRMIEFADKNNLEIVLAYYPPYPSKYNPVERCCGILENHGSATLLNTLAINHLGMGENDDLERLESGGKTVGNH